MRRVISNKRNRAIYMNVFSNTIANSFMGWWWRIQLRGGDVRA